jgi:type IV secretory pathway TrbF-like protein
MSVPSTAPITANAAAKGFFERFGGPTVESSRWFSVSVLLLIVVLAQGIAISQMLPLKTVVPYKIEVTADGRITNQPIAATEYVPGINEKKYFLSQWTTKLFTLDRFFTEKYLLDAYAITRDQASSQFSDYVSRFQPLIKLKADPTLNQQVTIRSVSFVQEGVALVRFRIDTRADKQALVSKDLMLTINYAIVTPKTEQEIYQNPIGLVITQFAVSEDIT